MITFVKRHERSKIVDNPFSCYPLAPSIPIRIQEPRPVPKGKQQIFLFKLASFHAERFYRHFSNRKELAESLSSRPSVHHTFLVPGDLRQAGETGLKPADLIQRRVKPSLVAALIARAEEEVVVIELSMKSIVG